MLPFVWALMVLAVVGGFVMIVAYWLDVQDRPTSRRGRKWAGRPASSPSRSRSRSMRFVAAPLATAPQGRVAFIPAVALFLFLLFVFGVLG